MAPDTPSPTTYKIKGEPVWTEGKGIMVPRDKVNPNDKLRILVSGVKDMEVLLAAFILQSNSRKIDLDETVYDDANPKTNKTYILELGDDLGDGTVSIKFTKYTGNCQVRITSDGSQANTKTLAGVFTNSITQFTLTKEQRDLLGILNVCYIDVTADQESTYMLRADFEEGQFVMLDDDITIIKAVGQGKVDNYLYSFLAKEQNDAEDNLYEFALGAEVIGESLSYGVRRC